MQGMQQAMLPITCIFCKFSRQNIATKFLTLPPNPPPS
jgi:hypothetical protein